MLRSVLRGVTTCPAYDKLVELTISHDARRIEVYTKVDGDWSKRVASDGGVAELGEIGCSLDVRELYDAAAEPPG